MADYYISQIYPSDKRANDEVDALLISEGIRRDANLDYTCGMTMRCTLSQQEAVLATPYDVLP